MLQQLFRTLVQFPKRSLIAIIELYQQTLSPDHGPLRHLYTYGYCRHEPTCSEYGKRIIAERGVIIGTPLLLWRILHCHPWAKISDEKVLKIIGKR
jgi:hypothetical protein